MKAKKILSTINQYKKFKSLPQNDFSYNYFLSQKEEMKKAHINFVKLSDFVSQIMKSDNLDILVDTFETVDENCIYKSEKHGIKHNIRVSLYAFYLSDKLKLDRSDVKTLLYACMYHDIGRVNDNEDLAHGARSARLVDKLDLKISEEERRILKTIITCHSLPDDRFSIESKKHCFDCYERCETLFKLLKDSDALDRTRLEYPYIEMSYLRCEESKTLIALSYLLEFNLRKRLNFLDSSLMLVI